MSKFLWEKNEWRPISLDFKQFYYHVLARCWDTIRNSKTAQHCRAKDCLAVDME